MAEDKKIRAMVKEDLTHAQLVWEASSYDSEKLEKLFHLLLEHYAERIEGFVKGLHVLQPYEATADKAEIYRQNVSILLDRLKAFEANGCKNEGLMEYYIRRDKQKIDMNADFTSIRLQIGMMPELHYAASGRDGKYLRAGDDEKGKMGGAAGAYGLALRQGRHGCDADSAPVFQDQRITGDGAHPIAEGEKANEKSGELCTGLQGQSI